MAPCLPDSRVRFDTLTHRNQLLLWSARMWVTASSQRPSMPPCIREAFDITGVPEAAESLHELLSIITTGADRTIHFRPVNSPMVSPEEARFLTLLAAAKERAAEPYAYELLVSWMPPAAARLALAAARDLATQVFEHLTPSGAVSAKKGNIRNRPDHTSPDPGLSLLH